MKNFLKSLLATVVIVVAYMVVGTLSFRGVDAFLADYRQEQKMAVLWAEFLEVPKDYTFSSTDLAIELVSGWNSPPSENQRAVLENEVAPRVNHLLATNGQYGKKMFDRYKPAIEHVVAKAR